MEKAIGSPKSAGKVRVTSAKKTREPAPVRSFDANVNAIARAGDTLYAATSEGMLRSVTAGESWKLVTGLERQNWNFVSTAKSWVAAATLNTAMLSSDGGQRWSPVKLPENLEQLAAVAVDDSGGVWVGGREGIFVSEDRGASWQSLKNLAIRDVNSLFYDEPSQRMLISANSQNTIAFSVHLPDRAVRAVSGDHVGRAHALLRARAAIFEHERNAVIVLLERNGLGGEFHFARPQPFGKAAQHWLQRILRAQAIAHGRDLRGLRAGAPGHAALDLFARERLRPDDHAGLLHARPAARMASSTPH